MIDIPGYEHFVEIEPIEKGWSGDKKYGLTSVDGVRYLLRITSSMERYASCQELFERLQSLALLDVNMSRPLAFGTCAAGIYTLYSWVEGVDAEEVLPQLSQTEQYALGYRSGEFLSRIHSLPAPVDQESWAVRFNRKIDRKMQLYRECGLRFAGDEQVIRYLNENRCLLEGRPQCFQHGDYHVGNMMMEKSELVIIDFDRFDYGDPWEEFNRIVWSAKLSPSFATAQLRGYFNGEPPQEFFRLLAFYIAANTLSSIPWAIPFGPAEVETMMKQSQDVLHWFDHMRNPVPTWYLKRESK